MLPPSCVFSGASSAGPSSASPSSPKPRTFFWIYHARFGSPLTPRRRRLLSYSDPLFPLLPRCLPLDSNVSSGRLPNAPSSSFPVACMLRRRPLFLQMNDEVWTHAPHPNCGIVGPSLVEDGAKVWTFTGFARLQGNQEGFCHRK